MAGNGSDGKNKAKRISAWRKKKRAEQRKLDKYQANKVMLEQHRSAFKKHLGNMG